MCCVATVQRIQLWLFVTYTTTPLFTHTLSGRSLTPHSLPSLCCHENKPRDFIKVQEAVALLKKPKKARKAHPLFARGFDEMLTMRVCDVDILH